MIRSIFVITLLFISSICLGEIVISHTYLERDLKRGTNVGYEHALLVLSLEKSKEKYGDYRLEPIEQVITQSRAVEFMRSKRFKNYIRTLGYNQELEKKHQLTYVKFPAYLGLLGYRTCLLSEKIKERFAAVKTIQQLQTFSHGVGVGWADAEILRANNFDVQEIANFSSLSRMAAANRIDLFCRGASEILGEYEELTGLSELAYDRAIAIYYPIPHFFYTHKSNRELVARVNYGIHRAHADGSLMALWKMHFGNSIEFAKLSQRRLFVFDSPLVKNIDFNYEDYIYEP